MNNIPIQIPVMLGIAVGVLTLMLGYSFIMNSNSFDAITKDSAVAGTQVTQKGVAEAEVTASAETETATGFTLSTVQIEAFVALGIDPAAVPATVSAAQEVCLREVYGYDRVEEIKTGAIPDGVELVRAQSCI